MYNLNTGLLAYLFEGKPYDSKYYITLIIFMLVTIASAYLLGSINASIIVSKTVYHDDIKKHGSGNAGMTNMLRTFGTKAALLTLLGDLLKTALAILVSAVLFGFNYVGGVSLGEGYCYIAALFAVIGHVYPIYYGFKGGKGVLATAVAALMLTPIQFAVMFSIFIIIVVITRYVSLASVISATFYPVSIVIYIITALKVSVPTQIIAATALIALLIDFCHRGNIKRLISGTENKISFGKKK